jgi:hypothetical protein
MKSLRLIFLHWKVNPYQDLRQWINFFIRPSVFAWQGMFKY